MYCLFGLIGTLIMGLLGREAWNDSRAWRGLFAGASGPGTWRAAATQRCAATPSSACSTCVVRGRPVS